MMEVIFFVCMESGEVLAKHIHYSGRNEEWFWVEDCTQEQVDMLRRNARERCGEVYLRAVRKLDPAGRLTEGNYEVIRNLDGFVSIVNEPVRVRA